MPCPCDAVEIVSAPGLAPVATMVPGLMLVDESLLVQLADPDDDFAPVVMAHEAAHLWFGCLVEGHWWDDLWLAEAMATYLSYRAGEAIGTVAPWAAFGLREQGGAYDEDTRPGVQPVASPVESADQALSRPFAITYAKGASVLRQLAASIGDAAFVAGLHDWPHPLRRRDGLTRSGRGLLVRGVGARPAPVGRGLAARPGRGHPAIRAPPRAGRHRCVTGRARRSGPGEARRGHRIDIGLYDRKGERLTRRRRIEVDVVGPSTEVAALAGVPAPDALVLNDGDLTFAAIRPDRRSLDP